VSRLVIRSSVTVRPACGEDVASLLELLAEMREALGRRAPRGTEAHRASPQEQLESLLGDAWARVLVAESAGEVLGMAHLHVVAPTFLADTRLVHAAMLHVRRSARARGAGRALMIAATAYAEEVGAEHVSVDVYPQHRESQRFYVRLGFAPLVVRRVAPVALLKRKLGVSTLRPAVATVGQGVDTASRRGVRARLETAKAVSAARRRAG
jgi:GNAT superfamily N-acetyltransferase